MKKIFKMIIHKISTKLFNTVSNMIDRVDKSYKCIKLEDEIASRKLIDTLKRHITLSREIINDLNKHIQKLNKVK